MTNQYFEEWYTEFITPRGYLLETRGIKSFLKEAWDAGAASQQAEPSAPYVVRVCAGPCCEPASGAHMSSEKVKCRECGWRGTNSQILTGPNPFDADDAVDGCPNCKSVSCFEMECEHGDCNKPASCGTPHSGGYANTCFDHRPVERTGG